MTNTKGEEKYPREESHPNFEELLVNLTIEDVIVAVLELDTGACVSLMGTVIWEKLFTNLKTGIFIHQTCYHNNQLA